MIQQELTFFWPLTEQIPLDLDFTPSEKYCRAKYSNIGIGGIGITCSADTPIKFYWNTPNDSDTPIKSLPAIKFCLNDSAGHCEVNGKDFLIERKKKPNWLRRTFNKLLIGWEWKDKK